MDKNNISSKAPLYLKRTVSKRQNKVNNSGSVESAVNRNASPGLKNTIVEYLATIKVMNGIINLLCLII